MVKDLSLSEESIPPSEGAPSGRQFLHWRPFRPFVLGLLALVASAAMGVVEAVRIAASSHRQVFEGDGALLVLGARAAWGGHQLLGPYSRFGWHHPGPVLFYLLALPNQLLGTSGPGIYLGAVLINTAAAIAAVAFVWRRAGVGAALWTSACLSYFAIRLTPDFIRQPWNPYIVVIPLVLMGLLLADGAMGQLASLVWAFVIGSVIVQTDISTLPVAGLLFILAAGFALVRWRRVRRRTMPGAARGQRRSPWLLGAAACSVLVWIPPIIELWTNNPNNVRELGAFFLKSHPTHTLHEAVHASLLALTVVPFGVWSEPKRTHAQIVLGGLAILVVAGTAVVVCVRRRQLFAAAIAGGGLIAVVGGIASMTRVVGPIEPYLALWQAFIPVLLLVAVGVAVFGPSELTVLNGDIRGISTVDSRATISENRVSRHLDVAAIALVAALAVAASIVAVVDDVHSFPVRQHSDQTITALASGVRRMLLPSDREVGIRILSHSVWPQAAGLTLELERQGRHTTVGGAVTDDPGAWTNVFEPKRRPNGREVVDVLVYLTNDPTAAAEAIQARPAGEAAGVAVAVRRPGSRRPA